MNTHYYDDDAHRQTADERRVAVLDAATTSSPRKGLHGASTEDIARAAGISQPYLFRLFGTKKELYLATSQAGGRPLYAGVRGGRRAGKTGMEALQAMGETYEDVMADRDRLMLMLKCWASCDDPEICEAVRSCLARPRRPRRAPLRRVAGGGERVLLQGRPADGPDGRWTRSRARSPGRTASSRAAAGRVAG